jgi:glycine cleavage system H lipoate-binding protein
VNAQVEEHLEILSKDPWKAGWLIRIKPNSKSLDDLMDAAAYEKFLAEQH